MSCSLISASLSLRSSASKIAAGQTATRPFTRRAGDPEGFGGVDLRSCIVIPNLSERLIAFNGVEMHVCPRQEIIQRIDLEVWGIQSLRVGKQDGLLLAERWLGRFDGQRLERRRLDPGFTHGRFETELLLDRLVLEPAVIQGTEDARHVASAAHVLPYPDLVVVVE